MGEVLRVLAHRSHEKQFLYRVQYSDRRCAWVLGSELDTEANRRYLVSYWRNGGNAVMDATSQCDPAFGFNGADVMHDMLNGQCAFVEFRSGGDVRRDRTGSFQIVSIDWSTEQVTVQYEKDVVETLALSEVKAKAPRLVAEYVLQHMKE